MSDEPSPQDVPPAAPDGGAPPPPPQRFIQPYPGAAPVPVSDAQAQAHRPSPGSPQGGPRSAGTPPYPSAAPPYAPAAPQSSNGGPQYPLGAPQGLPTGPAQPKPADPRSKALAVVALSLAIGGTIFTVLPVLSLLSAPILVAAFVCALIALIGRTHGGKGFSIAALATSVLTGVVATVVVIGSALLFGLGGWWHSSTAGNPLIPFSDTDDGYPDDGYTDDGFTDEEGDEYGAALDIVQGEVVLGSYDADQTAWWYGVVLENPNPDAIFEDVQIAVQAYDADGNVVDTDEKYLTIQPGPTAIAGMFLDAGDATITELRLELPDPSVARLIDPTEAGSVTVEDVQTTTNGDMPVVTGTLVNGTADEQPYAQVVVLARDANGTLLAAEPGYLDLIPAGESLPFEVTFYDPLPTGVTFEAYVTL